MFLLVTNQALGQGGPASEPARPESALTLQELLSTLKDTKRDSRGSTPSNAFATCSLPKDFSSAREQATELVRQLPEVQSTIKSGPVPLTLRADDFLTVLNDRCYWSVGIYETKKHPFAVGLFLVGAHDGEILALDESGEFVKLEQWRSGVTTPK